MTLSAHLLAAALVALTGDVAPTTHAPEPEVAVDHGPLELQLSVPDTPTAPPSLAERPAREETKPARRSACPLIARYYWPQLGRWVSADPLMVGNPASAADGPRGLDVYAYALGNPFRFIDPLGLVNYDTNSGDWSAESGDTLQKIASQTGFTSDELVSANPSFSADATFAGGEPIRVPQTDRIRVFQEAAGSIGRTDWSLTSTKGPGFGEWKCNLYISDMVEDATEVNFPDRYFEGVIPTGPVSAETLAGNEDLEGLPITPTRRIGDIGSSEKHAAIFAGDVAINRTRSGTTQYISPSSQAVTLRSGEYMRSHGFDPETVTHRMVQMPTPEEIDPAAQGASTTR